MAIKRSDIPTLVSKSPKMAASTKASRTPRPPEELIDALQDRIHPASGRLLSSKPVKSKKGK